MIIRTLLACGIGLAAVLSPATAQDAYPNRPVKLVVPFSAGSTADLIARMLADRLSARLKQPYIVDNRAGAGGSVGLGVVAKSPADGYTLLLTTSSPLTINPILQKSISYNVEKEFAPIGRIAWVPVILVGNPSLPAKSLPELITFLKNNPGKYGYATSGQGSYAHITMEMFRQSLGLELTHIPYKGPAQAETDVVAGQVALMFDGIATANPLIQAGRLRPYGITSLKRSVFAPEIPTFVEHNRPELKNFEVTSWVSMMAPAGTPPAVINRLNSEINEALKSTDFKARLYAKSFMAYEPNSPKDIPPIIRAEQARWAKVISDGNIQAE
jgi:tripartite-type tricarboxylate transporter receptor subunit TctC